MDGSNMCQKAKTSEAVEINKLLDNLEKSNALSSRETLKALSRLVSSSNMRTYFCRLGGIKKILKFMEKNEKHVDAIALSILGSCSLNDTRCQAELAENEQIFYILSKVLEKADSSAHTLLTIAMMLLSSIVTTSGIGQSMVRESNCLYHLVVVFLQMLQQLCSENTDNASIFSTWENLCITIKKCVNDPRNEINQHQVNTIIPKSIQFLEKWFQRIKIIDSSAKYAESLVSMLTQVVACNPMNQTNFAEYSGLHVIISGITILDNCEMQPNSNSNSIQEKLVQLLDATIANNSQNCISAATIGGIPTLLQLLVKLKNKHRVSVLIALTHLLEMCDANREEFIKLNGFSSVVLATLNMEEYPEVGQAASCLINFCARNLANSTSNMMEDNQNSEILANWIAAIHAPIDPRNSAQLPAPQSSTKIICQDISASASKSNASMTDRSNFTTQLEDQSSQNKKSLRITVDKDDVFVSPKQPQLYTLRGQSGGLTHNCGYKDANSEIDDAYFHKPSGIIPQISVKNQHLLNRQQQSHLEQPITHRYVGSEETVFISKKGHDYAASDVGFTQGYVRKKSEGGHNHFRGRMHAGSEAGYPRASKRGQDYAESDVSYHGCKTFKGVKYERIEGSYKDHGNVGRDKDYSHYTGNSNNIHNNVGNKRSSVYADSKVGSKASHKYNQKNTEYNTNPQHAGSSLSSIVNIEHFQSEVRKQENREYAQLKTGYNAYRVHAVSSAVSTAGQEDTCHYVMDGKSHKFPGNNKCLGVYRDYAHSDVVDKKSCSHTNLDVGFKSHHDYAVSIASFRSPQLPKYAQSNTVNKETRKYAGSTMGSVAEWVCDASVITKAARRNVKTKQRNRPVRGTVQLPVCKESCSRTTPNEVNYENAGSSWKTHNSHSKGIIPEQSKKLNQRNEEVAQFSETEVDNLQDGVSKFGMDFKKICKSYVFNSKTSHDLYNKWRYRFVQPHNNNFV